jgi:hypothetical protein
LTRDAVLSTQFLKTPPVAAGNFMPTSGINVTGSAKIYLNGNQNEVRLENFSVSSGPDLKVYLSKRYTNRFCESRQFNIFEVYAIPTQVNQLINMY